MVLLFKTGIITFDSNAALHNTFNSTTYQKEKALKTLVGNKFKKIASKWGTRIDKAEKIARDKLFTRERGDRPEATNVMLIFTDGKPTGLKEPDRFHTVRATYGWPRGKILTSVLSFLPTTPLMYPTLIPNSRTPLTITLKGNETQFELAVVRVRTDH